MEYFAQALSQPKVAVGFVIIILLIALRPLYQAIFSMEKVNRDLREAIAVLSSLGKPKQSEFYNQFKTVHASILRIPVLRHAWRQFVDSMYFDDTNAPEAHKKAYTSHRPSDYFNRDDVLGAQLNLSQFLAYPNYLIGIGLTFTFIGLAAALHVAQEGLASGAGQQALKDLLAVASVKFISSIAGVFCSLVISAVQRVRIRTFQENMNAFCDLLEECTKYKSTESLLHDSFNELRRHTAIHNHMGANIAAGISQELSTSVTNGLEPLTQDIRSLAQNFAEGSEQALGKMLDVFLVELHNTSNAEMQGLMVSAQTLQASLSQLASHMDSVGKSVDASTRNSVQELNVAVNNLATSFAPIQLGMTQFGQVLQSLEAVAGKIEQAGSNIHSASLDNQTSTGEFTKAMMEVSTPLATMSRELSSLSQSLSHAEESSLAFKTAGGVIVSAADAFKQSVALIKNSEDTFGQHMQTLASSAQGANAVIAVLEKASGQLSDAATSLASLDRQFSKSVDSLGGVLQQIGADNPTSKPKTTWWKH